MNTVKTWSVGLLVTILAILIAVSITVKKNNNSLLKSKGIIISGKIISFENAGKMGIEVDYSFVLNNRNYRLKRNNQKLIGKYLEYLRLKEFPLIILKDNPDLNKLLISPYDYQELNMNFPDSMQWVLPYIKE